MSQTLVSDDLQSENRELRERLEAAEETLRAIRSYEVDALVVGLSGSERVFSLGGADEAYRTFVEAMPQGAVTVSRDGTIVYCNRYFAQLVRSPVEKTTGASLFDFVSSEDEGLLRATLWEGLSTSTPKRQFSLRASDGVGVPAAVTATPLVLQDVTNVCLLISDLTEHEARLAAESASAAKDRFLALLSHELRTPLTPALLAAAAMQANPDLPSDVRENLAMVRRNIELETRLIEDLLDLSRVISGKLSLRRQQVDLRAVLRRAMETVGADVAAKQLELQCDVPPGIVRLHADPARLQQVFWNLLKNAIKFSRSGGKITIRCDDTGTDAVRVQVQDDGEGIDAAVIEKIFEPFEQGDNGDAQPGGGLGLGLSIAKAVVEAHGGSISAQSKGRGRGASLVVDLPRAADPASEAAQPQPEAAKTTRALRVLLVEDHPDTARALAKVLRLSGHEVEIAGSVAIGLRLAAAQHFELVISDIGLPDGTGYDLMRQIRQRHPIPGIALTGYGMDADVQSSADAGFATHITKPVELEQLHDVIARVMSLK